MPICIAKNNVSFIYTLKTSENQKGYSNRKIGRKNGLTYSQPFKLSEMYLDWKQI